MILTDERAVQAVKAALRWMKAHNVQWLKTEEKIYSRKYDFAGTMDGLAYVDSCDDQTCCIEKYKHRLCVVDWKTSNYLSTTYCFQTAAYQQALQEENNYPIESRWVLRLGKTDEEAGKFEPWFLSNDDFKTDLDAFLACLTLTRLVDSVEERMKSQKSSKRAIRKEQKATAKALQREQEKLKKAMDKAAAKAAKEIEKQKIKAEAKAERERLKAEKKAPKNTGSSSEGQRLITASTLDQSGQSGAAPLTCTISKEETCTSLEKEKTHKESITTLATTLPQDLSGSPNRFSIPRATQENSSTILTEETKCTSTMKQKKESSGQLDSMLQQESMDSLIQSSSPNPITLVPEMPQPECTTLTEESPQDSKVGTGTSPAVNQVIYETETYESKFSLPMEG